VWTTVFHGEHTIVIGAEYRNVGIGYGQHPRPLARNLLDFAHYAPLAHE
jgi:hypothetical protein